MFFYLLPSSTEGSLRGLYTRLHARFAEGLRGGPVEVALDPAARDASDRRSHGSVVLVALGQRVQVVERTRRGTGGENAAMLALCGTPRPAASAFPRRWELHETYDERLGDLVMLVHDAIMDEAPGALALDPRRNERLDGGGQGLRRPGRSPGSAGGSARRRR